jgi:hypothetical protein
LCTKDTCLKKYLAVGIILLLGVMVVVPCVNATVCKTSSNSLVELNGDSNQLYTDNETKMFCFIKSGDVQLRNFRGRFHGIPITTNSGIRHLGIGTFQLDLLGWNNSNETSLTITQFRRTAWYFHDLRINVGAFIGWYQPTGDLSSGVLSGFALIVKISPVER